MAGLFLTFEGIDGAGKTTQAKRLVSYLVDAGYPAIYLREPGGCALGEELRNVLLRTKGPTPSRRTELLLFGAARAQVVEEVVQPALAANKIVVLDRFIDTTVAYQGFGRGLPLDFVERMNNFAIGDTVPVKTFMLLLTDEESAHRQQLRGDAADRFESEDSTFKKRIRDGFLRQAQQYPGRIIPIDASPCEDDVAATIAVHARLIVHRWLSL